MRTITAAVLPCLLAFPEAATSQDWPARPMTMVVPFAAGGQQDVLGRVIAQRLAAILGRPLVIDNVSGGGGITGVQRVAKAPPDGYQFLLSGIGIALNQALYKKPPYNAVTDFAPVASTTESHRVLIVRKDLPADTLVEFIDYAKASQSKMQFGSSGTGTPTHIPCVLLTLAIGVSITHVPYRGSGPAMQDLIGGRTDFMCESVATAAVQIAGKTVKPIAVLASSRLAVLPNVPTAEEQGLKGVEASAWSAVFLPKGTPEAIVRKLNKALSETLEDPGVHKRLEELGFEVVPRERRTPEYLAKHLSEETKRWSRAIQAAGISTD